MIQPGSVELFEQRRLPKRRRSCASLMIRWLMAWLCCTCCGGCRQLSRARPSNAQARRSLIKVASNVPPTVRRFAGGHIALRRRPSGRCDRSGAAWQRIRVGPHLAARRLRGPSAGGLPVLSRLDEWAARERSARPLDERRDSWQDFLKIQSNQHVSTRHLYCFDTGNALGMAATRRDAAEANRSGHV